jgi:hypothetical protein
MVTKNPVHDNTVVPLERIGESSLWLREQQVILDALVELAPDFS